MRSGGVDTRHPLAPLQQAHLGAVDRGAEAEFLLGDIGSFAAAGEVLAEKDFHLRRSVAPPWRGADSRRLPEDVAVLWRRAGLDQVGEDRAAATRATVLQRQAFGQLPRDQHRGALLQLFDVPPAHVAGHFDLIGGVGPQQPWVLWVGDRELDLHHEDRRAARTTALPRVVEQLPGDDRVVEPGRRLLGEEPRGRVWCRIAGTSLLRLLHDVGARLALGLVHLLLLRQAGEAVGHGAGRAADALTDRAGGERAVVLAFAHVGENEAVQLAGAQALCSSPRSRSLTLSAETDEHFLAGVEAELEAGVGLGVCLS